MLKKDSDVSDHRLSISGLDDLINDLVDHSAAIKKDVNDSRPFSGQDSHCTDVQDLHSSDVTLCDQNDDMSEQDLFDLHPLSSDRSEVKDSQQLCDVVIAQSDHRDEEVNSIDIKVNKSDARRLAAKIKQKHQVFFFFV